MTQLETKAQNKWLWSLAEFCISLFFVLRLKKLNSYLAEILNLKPVKDNLEQSPAAAADQDALVGGGDKLCHCLDIPDPAHLDKVPEPCFCQHMCCRLEPSMFLPFVAWSDPRECCLLGVGCQEILLSNSWSLLSVVYLTLHHVFMLVCLEKCSFALSNNRETLDN